MLFLWPTHYIRMTWWIIIRVNIELLFLYFYGSYVTSAVKGSFGLLAYAFSDGPYITLV